MANFDRFSVVCNWGYFFANYQNVVHCQVLVEANPQTVMENAVTFVFQKFAQPYLGVTTDQLLLTSIVARRLQPAISDVFVSNVNFTGSRNEFGLPGTCNYLLRYYGDPYEKGTSYHWKLPGVGRPGNNAGNVTDEKIAHFQNLLAAITSGPSTINGNQFVLTVPHKSGDPIGVARPVIRRANVDGKIRNLRSRQVYA